MALCSFHWVEEGLLDLITRAKAMNQLEDREEFQVHESQFLNSQARFDTRLLTYMKIPDSNFSTKLKTSSAKLRVMVSWIPNLPAITRAPIAKSTRSTPTTTKWRTLKIFKLTEKATSQPNEAEGLGFLTTSSHKPRVLAEHMALTWFRSLLQASLTKRKTRRRISSSLSNGEWSSWVGFLRSGQQPTPKAMRAHKLFSRVNSRGRLLGSRWV